MRLGFTSTALLRRALAVTTVVGLGCSLSVANWTGASAAAGSVPGGWVVRVSVPEAIGGKTVIGQLTVDRATGPGYVTAYGCADGVPDRSDLNFNGLITPAASNRLIVQADANGDVCFLTTARVDIVVDVNAVSFDVGIESFPNRRTDTRSPTLVPRVPAGGVVRVVVPEAVGGKAVIGQLTVDRASGSGYVTAYDCHDPMPVRSDVNYNGSVNPVASNRLIVQAGADGAVCFYAKTAVDIITDVNAVADVGIVSFPNRRIDTRTAAQVPAGGVLRLRVPEAAGAKTVIGQLTVDRATDSGYVTAYGCDTGMSDRSDLNFNGFVTPAASNRLVVQADDNGDVCFLATSQLDMIVDVNAVSGTGITSFANQRTDTRTGTTRAELPALGPIPVWPPFQPQPALDGIAALTGAAAGADVTSRPIVAVKIDNYRLARPQYGLDLADAVLEVNVEGVTRFIALYQTNLPDTVGPVRSARTADLDLLTAMNRPVFGFSGANVGVDAWIGSAASSGVLVDFSAQRQPCYRRTLDRPGPHNLLLDAACAVGVGVTAGPARPLWTIAPSWVVPSTAGVDTTFTVPMDGVRVDWSWDPVGRQYLRSQDGAPHLAASGVQISARTVVELSSIHVPSPVDARSPNPITVGSGGAVVHRNGRSLNVVWSRPTAYDPFTFSDAVSGAPVPLDGGTTFIEVVRA